MDHSEKVNRLSNPREQANIISFLTFGYTGKLFAKGFQKDLEDDELYDVLKTCQSQKCTDELETEYFTQKNATPSGRKVSIYKILFRLYGTRYFMLGFLHMTWRLLTSSLEPVAISNLVAYFNPGQTTMTINDAIHYAALMVGLKIFHVFYYQNYYIYLTELAIQIRISFSSMIYRKALKLSPKALENTSLGNIVTIITKDIQQFEQTIWMFNDVWISVVQTVVICYLIYESLGLLSLVGVIMILGIIPVQALISRIVRNLRLKMSQQTDERLQRMQESLSTIKTVKMYTWEQIFVEKIGEARVKELKLLLKAAYSKMCISVSSGLVARLSLYAVLMMYIWIHHDMAAEHIYYVIKIFGALRVSASADFALGFTKIGELSATLKRIESILELEELPDIEDKTNDKPQVDLSRISVRLHGKDILKNISLKFEIGLNIITGQLSSGKSSLIKAILRDYPVEEGELRIKGRMSYAAQDPWLFPSSIRQNILFGEQYDENRYKQIISACALEYDFHVLENGDETIITDKGMNLSKGQQARINLARAVYKESDIYLIDDSLTALDPKVQEHIFTNCIQGFLRHKCVILVTHNPNHIALADHLVILENSSVKYAGTQQHITQDVLEEFERFENVDKFEELDNKDVDVHITEKRKLMVGDKPVVHRKQVYHEEKKEGTVDNKLYLQYVKMGGYFLSSVLIVIFIIEIFADSVSQKMLSSWINQKADITHYKEIHFKNTTLNFDELDIKNTTTVFINDTFNVSAIDIRNIHMLEMEAEQTINVYTLLTIVIACMELTKSYLVLKVGMNASINVHKKMVDKVVKAKMTFFDQFFIGNILNRFAQDLGVIDESLPSTMSSFVGNIFHLFGIGGLIMSVNWKFIVPAFITAFSSVLMRIIYIKTARSLKRLEAATRSPIVGHLNSTMEGLTTVRAYKAQTILKNEFDKHQDLYTSAFHTSKCASAAFSFLLEFTSVLFVISIIVQFLFVDKDAFTGDVGLTLTQAGVLTDIINSGLIAWSNLENSMTSVERAMEYTTVDTENTTGLEIVDWPTEGEITYDNIKLKYNNSHDNILKGISFVIKPRTKMGIVGRTGAGKSSIISTLYRLYNYEGNIFIDGVELKTISLKFLRQHISIIPQDPILFSGTVRSNVDPLEEFTDEEIWTTLRKVHLDIKIPDLQTQVVDVNFSTGQRQLICLARAIIRKNKIVVLDEATANMDLETECLVQTIIKENFSECTLIIIAHRLDSILDCDKIMVLDRGQIIEFDEPQTLLQNKKSVFAEMVKRTKIHDQIKK